MESHYCPSENEHQYHESSLTLKNTSELYKEQEPENTASEFYYRKIFNENFNLRFHKLSKDICDECDICAKLKAVIGNCHHLHYQKKCQKSSDKKVATTDKIGHPLKFINHRQFVEKRNLANMHPCYVIPPGIRANKKKNLVSMISNMTNKTIANLYYTNLPTSEASCS